MYNGKGQRVLYDKSRIRRQIKVVTVLIILSRPTTTNMNVGMWKTWECWKLSAGGSFLLITTQLQHENQFGWDKGDDDHTWSLDQMFGGFHLVLPLLTRSSWLNGALRDDEAVYWVSTGNYEALAIGNWLYWVSRGHLCLYIYMAQDALVSLATCITCITSQICINCIVCIACRIVGYTKYIIGGV